jgi:hypothetical protein
VHDHEHDHEHEHEHEDEHEDEGRETKDAWPEGRGDYATKQREIKPSTGLTCVSFFVLTRAFHDARRRFKSKFHAERGILACKSYVGAFVKRPSAEKSSVSERCLLRQGGVPTALSGTYDADAKWSEDLTCLSTWTTTQRAGEGQ